MPGVCAVVVTHNRQALLRRCLAALGAQSTAPQRVLVVDNASTDGTPEMLAREYPQLDRLELPRNVGGAGGFHAGLREAHAEGAEWIWLMDDDTIPGEDALAALLAAADRVRGEVAPAADRVGEEAGSARLPTAHLLASRVEWTDGRLHPMNVPTLERRRMELVVEAARRRVLLIRSATFVSLLVHRSAVDRWGLPPEHFFIWADDIEYTSRIVLGGGGAYFVPDSVVRHETAAPADFRSAAPERFYFHVRNTLLTARAPGRTTRDRLLRLYILATTAPPYLLRRRDRGSLAAVMRGVRDGLRHPSRPRHPPGGR